MEESEETSQGTLLQHESRAIWAAGHVEMGLHKVYRDGDSREDKCDQL